MAELTVDELARLAGWLSGAGEPVAGPLRATLLTGGRSNLTYRLDDGVASWALRRPPLGGVVGSAHDVVREFRVVAALGDSAVPVARAVACDSDGSVLDAPCAVVSFVPGRTVRSSADLEGWTDAEVDRCAGQLVDVLASLHEIGPDAVGLADFGRPGSYGARQLRRWSTQWERMGADDARAARLHGLLADRVPEQERTTVVHGDYRVDNVLLDRDDPGLVLAVVDWELSTLGDPVADVATMCAYRHPAFSGVLGVDAAWTSPRFPSPDELRHRYEARAGVPLPGFGFHVSLAYYKLAVIAEGIAYRHRLGVTAGGDGYDGVAAAVPVLLEAGLEAATTAGR
jgi:aminoglycoside phosphotransferase (APT) family kinase protein